MPPKPPPRAPTASDPRRELDEMDFGRSPGSGRPPTGTNWADAPVTTRDLLAIAGSATSLRTDVQSLDHRVKALEDDRDAATQEALDMARARVEMLEAEEKRRREEKERAELAAFTKRVDERRAFYRAIFLLVLGSALGAVATLLIKR